MVKKYLSAAFDIQALKIRLKRVISFLLVVSLVSIDLASAMRRHTPQPGGADSETSSAPSRSSSINDDESPHEGTPLLAGQRSQKNPPSMPFFDSHRASSPLSLLPLEPSTAATQQTSPHSPPANLPESTEITLRSSSSSSSKSSSPSQGSPPHRVSDEEPPDGLSERSPPTSGETSPTRKSDVGEPADKPQSLDNGKGEAIELGEGDHPRVASHVNSPREEKKLVEQGQEEEEGVEAAFPREVDALLPKKDAEPLTFFGRPVWPQRSKYTLEENALELARKAAEGNIEEALREAPRKAQAVHGNAEESPENVQALALVPSAPCGLALQELQADLEAARGNPDFLFQKFLRKFTQKQFTPEELKAMLSFLVRFTYQVLEGRRTWPEWGAVVAAFVLAGVGAFTQGPIYDGGFLSVNTPFFNKLGDSTSLINYIMVSSFLPLFVVNADLFKRVAHYFSEKGEARRPMTCAIVVASLAVLAASVLGGIIDASYLIFPELSVMQELGEHGFNNSTAHFLTGLVFFVFANGVTSNWDSAADVVTSVRKFLGKIPAFVSRVIFRKVLPEQPKSPEEIIREDLETDLDTLTGYLAYAPAQEIDKIHETVKQIQAESIEPAQKSFKILMYLFSLADQVTEVRTQLKKSFYEYFSDGVIYGGAGIGSIARFKVLQFIFNPIFGFCSKIAQKVLSWFCACVGFPFQTGLEVQSSTLLLGWHQNPDGHSSHPWVRRTVRVAETLQTSILWLPLLFLTLQACDLSTWWMLLSVLFFLYPEIGTQAVTLDVAYGKQGTTLLIKGGHAVQGQIKKRSPPCSDCNKDGLIRLTQQSKKKLRSMPPVLRFLFYHARKQQPVFVPEERP